MVKQATVDGLNRDTASVTGPLLCWPSQRPASGSVSLRAFEPRDAEMAVEMSEDPYLPLIGSLPAHADADAALAWVHRQRSRTSEGVGFSFCVADRDDRAVGSAGLWTHGFWQGRATAGYAIRPSARGRGLAAQALRALTSFAFTLPLLHRVELYIEPDNHASRRVAERAAYVLEGTLRQHQEIGGRRRDMCLYAALRERQGLSEHKAAKAPTLRRSGWLARTCVHRWVDDGYSGSRLMRAGPYSP